jgi:NDP-sugar pyrophosphorylase family protein
VPDQPKVLAQVNGRPFLSYLLDQLIEYGFQKVILCTGYMGDKVFEAIGEGYKNLSVQYSRETESLGTGGALRKAIELVGSGTVLVMNGDSFINADLNAFLRWYARTRISACLLLTRVADTDRYGKVNLDDEGRVIGFVEKGGNQGPGWINAGVYLIEKTLVESIPPGKAFSLERDFFPALAGKNLYGYGCEAEFIDIGMPESYAKAEEFFSKL